MNNLPHDRQSMDASQNDSKQLALAAVMFFGIMVKWFLATNKNSFSQEEIAFIESYIQYGYITMISWVITIILVTIYYFYPSMILYWIHMVSIVVSILFLFIGTVWAMSGNVILQGKTLWYTSIQDERANIITYFIPLYNIYLRYKEHNFTNSNIRLKESIFLRSIRSVLWVMIQNQWLLIILLFLIVIRIATIGSGIDIMSSKIKTIIDKSFQVNPEECRAYIIASIDYITQQIQNKMIQPSRGELVLWYKKSYSHLHQNGHEIIIEYTIGAVWIIRLSLWITNSFYTRILYAPVILIVWRYLIMYIRRRHLPPLPLAREIRLTGEKIYTAIKNKLYHQ